MKDSDQTAHLNISDVNIGIKGPLESGLVVWGGMVKVGNFKKILYKKCCSDSISK